MTMERQLTLVDRMHIKRNLSWALNIFPFNTDTDPFCYFWMKEKNRF